MVMTEPRLEFRCLVIVPACHAGHLRVNSRRTEIFPRSNGEEVEGKAIVSSFWEKSGELACSQDPAGALVPPFPGNRFFESESFRVIGWASECFLVRYQDHAVAVRAVAWDICF